MNWQAFRRKVSAPTARLFVEALEDRYALDGTPWSSFGGNAQHTSVSDVAAQALESVHWYAQVDNYPTSRAAHYGGPLITANNTVIYPFKQGDTTTPDFHVVARSGINGSLTWDISTPYTPLYEGWYPPMQPVLATATNRVYFPGKGGTIYYRDNPDSATGTVTQVAFWGPLSDYLANQAAYDANVFIDTALTADSAGNIFFGFRVQGANPANLVSGIARITPAGVGTWVSAQAATDVGSGVDGSINKVAKMAPFALSNDGQSLYVVVANTSTQYYGRILKLNSTTLATQARTSVLKDPRNTNNAGILNSSTAAPMVAPDGRVFLGVFGNPYNGSRGWMLQFSGDLATQYTSGGFGWDTTPSVVPASMVPQYTGSSPYLIFTKYNNYYGITNGGDGSNMIAVLDPNDTEVDFHADSGGQLVMKRVLYKVGPTPDWDYPSVPTAVREWCINYGAVDPATNSIIVNSADGKFYRWHLPSDTFTEEVRLTSGIGQPYTMTVIGIDGTVYGIQIGQIFAMGQTPRMSINDVSITEGTGGSTVANFTVSLNYPRREAITVNYATANGTAGAGQDYTAQSGSLNFAPQSGAVTFSPGETSKTISIVINPDSLAEVSENFFVNLSGATNAVILDGQGQGTIIDDDSIPSLTIDNVAANEGNSGTTNFAFTVSLSSPSGLPVTVNFATANGTALAGSDYVAKSGTLTFNPGETSKTITVLVNGDTTYEGNESFSLNLTSPANATLADGSGSASITNDDAVPSITIGDVTVVEGTQAVVVVQLSNPSTQLITVNYASANGTAVSGSDYTAVGGQLTFGPGTTQVQFNVNTTNDSLDELDETFAINLTSPTNAFISDSQGIITITDNDPPPTVSIGDVSANEGSVGNTNFVLLVTLSAASGRTVTVDFSTASGTATSGVDFLAGSGTVTFNPGETSKAVNVTVVGDITNEANETFVVNLANASGATIADGQGQATIVNDDAALLTIGDVSVLEGNSGTTAFVFTVNLSAASAQTITVDYATAVGTASASDFNSASGTLTFNPGDTSKTFTVFVVGDSLSEADETFTVNLSNAVGGTVFDGQGVGTIVNDDTAPQLTIADISIPEFDYNTGTVNIYVTLGAPSGQTVTVDYQTSNGTASSTSANKDYIDTFGTLTFLPGETVKAIEVSVVGDVRDEPDETIRVLLSNAVNATIGDNEGIITIEDDDTVYGTITGTTVTEGDSGFKVATVTVDLSTVADYNITMDYATFSATALAGADFVAATGTLTFLAGITTQQIQIQILGDLIDELDESFEVRLSNPTPGVVLGTYPDADVDILDNDTSTVSINDVSGNEGNSGTNPLTFTVSLSVPSDRPISVNYVTANGTATAGSDYQATNGSVTIPAGAISQTITVQINGDTTPEANETFFVNLSNATSGAVFVDSQGMGTIVSDDAPALSISDVSKYEGLIDWTTFTFTVSLTSPSAQTVTVQYATADGTAKNLTRDYQIERGTLSFAPGVTSQNINIKVKGDKLAEPNETFFVNLSNPVNAVIGDSQGMATILDDDGWVENASDSLTFDSGLVNAVLFATTPPDSTGLNSKSMWGHAGALPGNPSLSRGGVSEFSTLRSTVTTAEWPQTVSVARADRSVAAAKNQVAWVLEAGRLVAVRLDS